MSRREKVITEVDCGFVTPRGMCDLVTTNSKQFLEILGVSVPLDVGVSPNLVLDTENNMFDLKLWQVEVSITETKTFGLL